MYKYILLSISYEYIYLYILSLSMNISTLYENIRNTSIVSTKLK